MEGIDAVNTPRPAMSINDVSPGPPITAMSSAKVAPEPEMEMEELKKETGTASVQGWGT